MKFQCGDFFALRGYSLISRSIRFLTFVRYGIPFKKTFSHVESAVDDKNNVSAIVFVTLFKGYIKEKDKLTEDCAETQSLIYSEDGRWISLQKPRNEFPNGMVQVWENLILNGVAEVIAEKEKGGDWNWRHKEENNN